MDKISQDNRTILIKIFQYLNKDLYKKAEFLLLKSLLQITSANGSRKKTNGADLNYCQTVYYRFNEIYLSWIKEIDGNLNQEINKLHNSYHDNFLLAHSRDAATLDDLLYELILFLSRPTPTQKKEVEYHLSCYKKLL